MRSARGAERGSRVNGRQERGALFLVDVLDDHLLVWRQRARSAKELTDRELQVLFVAVVRAVRRHRCPSVRLIPAAASISLVSRSNRG